MLHQVKNIDSWTTDLSSAKASTVREATRKQQIVHKGSKSTLWKEPNLKCNHFIDVTSKQKQMEKSYRSKDHQIGPFPDISDKLRQEHFCIFPSGPAAGLASSVCLRPNMDSTSGRYIYLLNSSKRDFAAA